MNVSCPDCRSIFRVDPAKVPPTGVRARCSVCGGVITIPAPTGQTTPSGEATRTPTPAERSSGAAPPTASSAASGWDTPPYAAPARQTPAPPVQRPAPALQPPRAAEVTATPRPSRPAPLDSGPVTATATPPSPSIGLPEFKSPPPVPPFTPRPAPGAPVPPFTPPTGTLPVSPFTPPTGSAPVSSPPPFVPSAPARPAAARPPATPVGAPPAGQDVGARRPLNPFLSKDPDQRSKRLARALVSDIITYHPAKHAEGLRDGTLKQLFREEIKKSFEEYIAQVGQPLAEGTTYFQEALNEVLAAGKRIF